MQNVESGNDHEQATESGGFGFHFGSIRTRLLVIFVLLVLLPALTIGAASAMGSWQSGKRQIQNELEGVAALKEDQIEFWLQGLRTEVSFELARESAPEQMGVLLQGAPGTADFQIAYDAQLARFQQTIDLKKDFEEFFLMDREGQVILSTEPDQVGKRYASQTFFKEGLNNLFVQPPLYSVAQDKVLVVLALPVRGTGDQVLGVLAGRVGMERLSEIMAQRTGLGETGETYLVGGNKALLTALRFPSDVSYIRTVGTNEAVENQTQGFDVYEDYQGVPVVGVYRWLPTLQVALMAEQDRAEAFNDIYDTLGIITGIALVAVLSAIVLGVFVTRGIANPLADLTATSQRIAAGDLTARAVGITSRDEIGVLATTFNTMADRVSNLLKSLEERSTELAERTRELEASQRVTFAASERVSPDELLSIVVNLIRDQFDLYHVQVYTVDMLPSSDRDAEGTEGVEAAVLRESTGYAGRQLLQRKHHIPLDRERSLVVQAIREGQPVLVDDVSQEPDFMPNPLLPDTRSELVVPLKVGKRVLGALDAQHREPGRFSESTIALFQTMADQISFLFENSELIERVSEQTESLTLFTNQLRTAADIARQLGTILDLEHLLEQLVEMMQSRFGLYHVHIYVMDETSNELVIRAGSGEVGRVLLERGHHIPLDAEKSLVASAAREREPVYVEDTSIKSDFMPNPLLPQTRSEVALPLVASDQVLGVLDVQDDQAGRFTEAELDTFSTLAGQLATALENARLFTQTQDLLAEVDQIFNSAGDGMRLVDKDFNTLRVNETFAAMAGLSEGEATDAKCYEILHGPLCNTPDCPLVQILGGQEHLEAEVDKERVDGTTFPCSVMATPFKAPDGEVIGIVEVFRDITARKEAEETLRQSEAQQRLIFEASPTPTLVTQPDGTILYANPQVSRLFGTSLEELISRGAPALYYDPADRQPFLEAMEREGGVRNYEVRFKKADGTIIWGLLSSEPITFAGQPALLNGIYDITDLKEAQAAIHESQQRFQGLVENLSDWIWEVDPNGVYTYVSPKVTDLLGYQPEEMLGKTPFDFMPPEEVQPVTAIFGEIIAGQKPIEALENTNIHKDGHLVVFETSGTPYYDAQGKFQGYRGTDRDITERVRAEQERDRFTNQLRTAADLAEQMNAILDPEQLLHEVVTQLHDRFNLYHVHIYLLDAESGVLVMRAGSGEAGRILYEQGHNIPIDREQSLVARAVRTQEIVSVQDISLEPDFMTNPLLPDTRSEVAVPLMMGNRVLGVLDVQDNQPGRFTQSDLDVFATLTGQIATALQNAGYVEQMEARLKVSQALAGAQSEEEVLDAIIQVADFYPEAGVTIQLFDLEAKELTTVARRSAAFESGLQYLPEGVRIPGSEFPLSRYIAPDKPFMTPNLLLDERVDPATREIIGVGGVISMAILPIVAGNEWLGVIATSSKQEGYFDQRKLYLYQALAEQGAVALHTARLRDEIARTAERLREVDRLKSEFLANMSHELRTPLNSILGYTEVMLMGINGDLDLETHEDVQAIYDNGQHLLRLINDILDLAKIEAGRMALNLEEVEIAPLLEDIKTNSAGLLVNKPVEMILEVEEGLPSIKADRTRVNQVLTNLVSNAAKFTEQGQVTLRAFSEGDGWICLEVQDTGIGIKEADLENIFEQFQQADGSFKRRAEGTGLGLAITRHLVTMHGGTISVHSQVGSGSTFIVRLPIKSHAVEVISGSSNGKQM